MFCGASKVVMAGEGRGGEGRGGGGEGEGMGSFGNSMKRA